MNTISIADHIINDNFYDYIKKHLSCGDATGLMLKKETVDFDKKFAITQIECRNKYKNKLPEILTNSIFLFPKSLSGEQCTHELIAKFHASLFNADDVVLDMTMGLGIDSYYISKVAKSVTAIEYDEQIAEVNKYNYECSASNLNVVKGNSEDYIRQCTDKSYTTVFIDPARRDVNNKRMFGFHDCVPDVVELVPEIKRCAERLVIKASPMLDITNSLKELQYVTDVWIIAIKNSCKELLFSLNFSEKTNETSAIIHTINFDNHTQQIDFQYKSKWLPDIIQGQISSGMVLLEPNVCIQKSGKSDDLSVIFEGIKKIEKRSNLFVSNRIVPQFPGRQLIVDEIIPFKDKNIKQLKKYKKLNVATRNFRLSADQLKTRLGVNDGGDIYLFGTTVNNGEMVLILCHKQK